METEVRRHVSDFGESPKADPSVYPGQWPTSDLLMVGTCLFSLSVVNGRRLEQALVNIDGHDESCPGPVWDPDVDSLEDVLLRLKAPPMAHRRPFLAVGSNANPPQLHKKFEKENASQVVPLTIATVKGLSIGYSSHVARGGYVPTTAVPGGSSSLPLVISWLDQEQADALNKSERGPYVAKVCGGGDGVHVTLGSGETLSRVIAYFSKFPAVEDDDGIMVPFAESYDDRRKQQPMLRIRVRKFDRERDDTLVSDDIKIGELLYKNQGHFPPDKSVSDEANSG